MPASGKRGQDLFCLLAATRLTKQHPITDNNGIGAKNDMVGMRPGHSPGLFSGQAPDKGLWCLARQGTFIDLCCFNLKLET